MDAKAPFELDVLIPTEKSVTTDAGDVIIEGYAADFEVDRQGEAFLPGAFDDACKKATRAEIPLLFEHDNKRQLGVIEELRVDPERGLWTRARIAKAQAGTWAEDVVDKVRRGMMKGLSVRGLSKVKMTANGPRIGTIDLAEISVTPVPVQPGALFAVAQKSFEAAEADVASGEIEKVEDESEKAVAYLELRMNDLVAAFDEVEQKLAEKSMGDFTDRPWSGSSSGYDDAQWKRACVLDRGAGAGDGKQRYGLPVREPDGTLNCRAVANARARISQVKGASEQAVARAQRKLDTFAKQCENYRSKSLTGCEKCDCADCANCDCIDCPCVNCQPISSKKSAAWQKKEGQNPKGGLNSKGRASLKAQGQNIRPGVKNYSKASTANKKRWISWALRFYSNPSGPLVDKNGKPTRLALTAAAWGEPVPKTREAALAIAAKARRRKAELERQGAYA